MNSQHGVATGEGTVIKVIKSEERHHQNFGWLDTRWHFSFDTYHDPANTHWGALRVFNDDVVEPGQGFGMHPHRDMEIITYVLSGELEHKDSMGNRGVVHAGEVQVMSAGTGVMHSEYNPSQHVPVHLLQLWIFPRMRNLTPRWEQRQFRPEDRGGKLLPVVSGEAGNGTLRIDQDAEIYVSALKAGEAVTHQSRAGRKAYLFVIEGDVTLNGTALAQGDQARIADETELKIKATGNSELILLDLPDAR
jgi:redox-sensitive bicupin YhaK (pirin superfamily)